MLIYFNAFVIVSGRFFKTIFLKNIQEHYQGIIWLNLDQDDVLLVLNWIQTVCKHYQQMTIVAVYERNS